MDTRLTKKEIAYQIIRQAIIAGDLRSGKIYNTAEFSEAYSLGITPIREALIILESEGYLRSLARTGFEISTISVQDVQETFHLRTLLEVEAIGLAVERISDSEIQQLKTNLQSEHQISMDPSTNRRQLAYQLNKEFHSIIAHATGNRRLANLVEQFIDNMERILSFDPYKIDPKQHVGILESLIEHNKSKAQEAMRDHLEFTRLRIYDRFS